jgi:hypothetical protein
MHHVELLPMAKHPEKASRLSFGNGLLGKLKQGATARFA